MADLAASIAKARKAGYSDAEIAAYIAKDPAMGPKVKAARQAGYSDAEVVAHLGKSSPVKDFFGAIPGGILKGAANAADLVMQANPFAQAAGTMQAAAGVANLFQGKVPQASSQPVSVASDTARRVAPRPSTVAGEYGDTIGENAVNALAPGGVARRAVNVFAPALISETAGQVARRSGAGPGGETAARVAGGLVGAGVASIRTGGRGAASPVETLARRTRQDPAAMRQRANEFRAAGVQPTVVDVVDDTGRGMVRAAANRPTPARQEANDFARARALNLPDRMSQQARRNMSADPRTPDQIRAEMAAQRSTNADQAFSAVRRDTVQLSPEGVQALRTKYGRDAIAEAANRERDPEIRAALMRLSDDALDNPSTPITVGMADRISRTLYGWAGDAGGDRDKAALLNGLAESIRGPTSNASTGYRAALDGYAADSRLTEAAGVGEDLMRPNTDEFVAAAGRLAPEERQLALAAGRRAVERKAGENVSAAPGIARRLADAPEQQQRNAALMGDRQANLFQQGMRSEAQAVENAQAIAPRGGSSTFLNAADEGNLAQAGGAASDLMRGRWGSLLGRAYDAWRSRGMSDAQIEQLVRMSIDPAQTDNAIRIIEQRLGPQAAQEFLTWRNAALIGAAAGTTAARREPQEPQ